MSPSFPGQRKGAGGVTPGLGLGHAARTQERAQNLQVWRGRKNFAFWEMSAGRRRGRGAAGEGDTQPGVTPKSSEKSPKEVQKRQKGIYFGFFLPMRVDGPKPPSWGVQAPGWLGGVWGHPGDTPGWGRGIPKRSRRWNRQFWGVFEALGAQFFHFWSAWPRGSAPSG